MLTLAFLSLTGTSRGDEPPAPMPPEGFQAIFNGRDLTGWEGSPEYWSVKDGCLTGVTDGSLRYNLFIIWRGGTLKNFELRVQVKVTPGGNSGLNYRSQHRPDLGDFVVTGYQCDVVAARPDYNGMLYEERGRRILAHTGEKVIIDTAGQPWVVEELPVREFKPGEWHAFRVLVRGNHHQHWIDDHPTVDVIDLDVDRPLAQLRGQRANVPREALEPCAGPDDARARRSARARGYSRMHLCANSSPSARIASSATA